MAKSPWQNLCKGWVGLKKWLLPRRPANLEEWGQLPLGRPHLIHRNVKLVKCTTRAQGQLRESGFVFMSDVFCGMNGFISWEMAAQRGTVPSNVWSLTWMEYRSAAENTFLWRLLYRILATQRWRFPDRPASDPEMWCTRCSLHVTEDLFHCIWNCPMSRQCWDWCAALLSWVSTGT